MANLATYWQTASIHQWEVLRNGQAVPRMDPHAFNCGLPGLFAARGLSDCGDAPDAERQPRRRAAQ